MEQTGGRFFQKTFVSVPRKTNSPATAFNDQNGAGGSTNRPFTLRNTSQLFPDKPLKIFNRYR